MIKTALLKSLGFTETFIEHSLNQDEIDEIINQRMKKESEVNKENKDASSRAFSKFIMKKLLDIYNLKIKSSSNLSKNDKFKQEEMFDDTAMNSERCNYQTNDLQLNEESDFSIKSKSYSSNCKFKITSAEHSIYHKKVNHEEDMKPSTTISDIKSNRSSDKKLIYLHDYHEESSTIKLLKNKTKINHKCNFPGCNQILPSSEFLSSHLDRHLERIRDSILNSNSINLKMKPSQSTSCM